MFKLPETEQEVFNIVYKHLLTQNAKAIHIVCRYRHHDNGKVLKCAAGCLIPDDYYTTDLEGAMWGQLVERELVPSAHFALIRDLQHVHDRTFPSVWKEELERVAKDFGLTVPNLLDQET